MNLLEKYILFIKQKKESKNQELFEEMEKIQ